MSEPAAYRAYGLSLVSERPLPGLLPDSRPGPEAVRVRLGPLPPWASGDAVLRAPLRHVSAEGAGGRPTLRVHVVGADGALLLDYADGTRFALDGTGTEVWADWTEATTFEDTATYLLGPVLGLLLRLRGMLAVHAGAVEVDGRAILLSGPAGAGKSTTTAALALAGHPVLTDDVAALREDAAGGWSVLPAFPRVRLWPDSAGALFGSADALPPITPGWDKRRLDLGEEGLRFSDRAVPLGAVYLLAEREDGADAPRVEPLAPAEALLALVAAAFGSPLLDAEARGRELQALGRVAGRIPVRRLVPHADPARLPDALRVLLADPR